MCRIGLQYLKYGKTLVFLRSFGSVNSDGPSRTGKKGFNPGQNQDPGKLILIVLPDGFKGFIKKKYQAIIFQHVIRLSSAQPIPPLSQR
jgi:hypothetical protein